MDKPGLFDDFSDDMNLKLASPANALVDIPKPKGRLVNLVLNGDSDDDNDSPLGLLYEKHRQKLADEKDKKKKKTRKKPLIDMSAM